MYRCSKLPGGLLAVALGQAELQQSLERRKPHGQRRLQGSSRQRLGQQAILRRGLRWISSGL